MFGLISILDIGLEQNNKRERRRREEIIFFCKKIKLEIVAFFSCEILKYLEMYIFGELLDVHNFYYT